MARTPSRPGTGTATIKVVTRPNTAEGHVASPRAPLLVQALGGAAGRVSRTRR